MTNRLYKIIAAALTLALMCALLAPCVSAAEDTKITFNRYNIVLVADTSGSMNHNDPDKLRFEAIGKFVAMLAERGNKVGSVVFNEECVLAQPLMNADGVAAKKGIVGDISAVKPHGYTNIGLALKTAVEQLDTGKDADLESIILLLSDGKTEMETEEQTQVSLDQKADAIEQARAKGYRIYTICLNNDGKASAEELNQIAQATGGEFREVKDSAGLEEVFAMYYELIYSSKQVESEEQTFPDSGEITGSFKIPSLGVEEFNIQLSGDAENYWLTNPLGETISRESIADMTYESSTYLVIKYTSPTPGNWSYTVKGLPGDKVQINIIFNTNLSAHLKITPDTEQFKSGESVELRANMAESLVPILPEQYDGFTAVLEITDGKGNTTSYSPVEAPTGQGYYYSFETGVSGTYTAQAVISSANYNLRTNAITLNVDNTPPTAGEDITKTVYLLPFSDNITKLDLKGAASDEQDTALRFEVDSASFLPEEYTLEDGILTQKGYSLSKGSYAIRAYDSEGAYCTFNVYIKTINVTVLALIIIGGIALIVLAALGIMTWLLLNKRFMGAVYVTPFDNTGVYYDEVKRETGRGRIPLSAFNLHNTGFNTTKCYFQASGKKHIFFVSGTKVYCSGRMDKQFQIDGIGYEVMISPNETQESGIRVRFVSRLNNLGY